MDRRSDDRERIEALMPALIEAALAERPPVDVLLDSEPAMRALGPGIIERLEDQLTAALRPHGIRACRKILHPVQGWKEPVHKTLYYRRAEQLLFDAMREQHPIVLAHTVESQRFTQALQDFAEGQGNGRQVWIWSRALGALHRTTRPGIDLTRFSTLPPDDAERLAASLHEASEAGRMNEAEIRNGDLLVHCWFRPSAKAVLAFIDDRELHDISQDRADGILKTFTDSIVEDADKIPAGSLVEAMRVASGLPPGDICILPDAHHFLDSEPMGMMRDAPATISALKEIYHRLSANPEGPRLVLLCGDMTLPKDLREEVLRVDLPLPGRRELHVTIRDTLVEKGRAASDELIIRLSEEAAGMTLGEVRAVLQRESSNGQDVTHLLQVLRTAKRRHVARSPALELVDGSGFTELGGMESFLDWLEVRRKAFCQPERARAVGIDRPPRGILLLGIPGSGKSLAAKVIARRWALPLVRLDVGALQDKWVGSSEARVREALKVVEAMAPCILWIDEIDKGISQGDGATSHSSDQNIKATLLTWMQENKYQVFIVATANRFNNLPPELTRAGRFDARFFFGCPGEKGRKEIFALHLRLRGYEPCNFDTANLATATHGFTGAEIEQVVLDSLYRALETDKTLSDAMLLESANKTKPLIQTAGKSLQEVWDLIEQGRVLPASSDMLTKTQVAKLLDPYLYRPVYCRLEGIAGFDKQGSEAARILMASPYGQPAAAVMSTGEGDWVYVQTNVYFDPADKGTFKFMDRMEAIEGNQVFDALVSDHALESIYFETDALRERFRNSEVLKDYVEMFDPERGREGPRDAA